MIILLKQPYFLAFERQKLMHRVVSQKMSYKADLEGVLERYWAYFFRKSTWAQPLAS